MVGRPKKVPSEGTLEKKVNKVSASKVVVNKKCGSLKRNFQTPANSVQSALSTKEHDNNAKEIDVQVLQDKLNEETAKRRKLDKFLAIERDRYAQLSIQLDVEKKEKASLLEQIGSLKYQLAAKNAASGNLPHRVRARGNPQFVPSDNMVLVDSQCTARNYQVSAQGDQTWHYQNATQQGYYNYDCNY